MRFSYRALPVISAVAWALTLLTLLLFWLGSGRPVFPSQGEPRIAFVSDVGIFSLKPLFIVGCAVTAISFSAALLRTHATWWLRNPPGGRTRILATLAVVAGLIAAICLILLSILDTYRFHNIHIPLLYTFCAGMLASAALTSVIDRQVTLLSQTTEAVEGKGSHRRLIRQKRLLVFLIASELCLLIAFSVLFSRRVLLVVGILEWAIAFLLVPYLWLIQAYMA